MKAKVSYKSFLNVVTLTPESEDVKNGVPNHPFEVMHRGHSVCTLVVSEDAKWCVLVHQFRAGEYLDSQALSGMSSAAGMIDKGETPMQAAIREAYEETGLEVKSIDSVGSFYTSPGGASEKSHMFIARADFNQNTILEPKDKTEGITLQIYPLKWAHTLLAQGEVTSLQLAYLLEQSKLI